MYKIEGSLTVQTAFPLELIPSVLCVIVEHCDGVPLNAVARSATPLLSPYAAYFKLGVAPASQYCNGVKELRATLPAVLAPQVKEEVVDIKLASLEAVAIVIVSDDRVVVIPDPPERVTLVPVVDDDPSDIEVIPLPVPQEPQVGSPPEPPDRRHLLPVASSYRLASDKVPVTPVERGRPVAFVSTAPDGVPKLGVVKDGEVAKTSDPLPVSSVTALARLLLDGVPRNVATPVPSEVIPVPPFPTGKVPVTPLARGSPVALVRVPLEGVPSAPPFVTNAPTEPTLVPSAVETLVPSERLAWYPLQTLPFVQIVPLSSGKVIVRLVVGLADGALIVMSLASLEVPSHTNMVEPVVTVPLVRQAPPEQPGPTSVTSPLPPPVPHAAHSKFVLALR
jgi:hypothetical protein